MKFITVYGMQSKFISFRLQRPVSLCAFIVSRAKPRACDNMGDRHRVVTRISCFGWKLPSLIAFITALKLIPPCVYFIDLYKKILNLCDHVHVYRIFK